MGCNTSKGVLEFDGAPEIINDSIQNHQVQFAADATTDSSNRRLGDVNDTKIETSIYGVSTYIEKAAVPPATITGSFHKKGHTFTAW